MTRPLEEIFVQQSAPTTCIAACVCMLRRRTGEDVSEADVVAGWGDAPPFACAVHGAAFGRYLSLHPDQPANREYLRARVSSDLLMVTIVPAPRRMVHAIVLIGFAERHVAFLDPAEPAYVQPRAITEEGFFSKWTGEVVEPPQPHA
jgi:hypothetical protein